MRDLQEVWSVRSDYNQMKAKVVQLYRIYVQEDVLLLEEGNGNDVEGPQKQYNRDREQMERSLDALRKSLHTDTKLHKRDLSKMMRENVLLTKEMNDLRKEAHSLQLQKQALQESLESGNKANINEVMEMLGFPVKPQSAGNALREQLPPPPTQSGTLSALPPGTNNKSRRSVRSTALRHVSSAGNDIDDSTIIRSTSAGTNFKKPLTSSRNDLREAWREYEMQTTSLIKLEEQLRSICTTLSLNADDILEDIDNILNAHYLS